jgi:hypothetical protein
MMGRAMAMKRLKKLLRPQKLVQAELGFLKFFILLSVLGWIAITILDRNPLNRFPANNPAAASAQQAGR